jgi:hypothetical protein
MPGDAQLRDAVGISQFGRDANGLAVTRSDISTICRSVVVAAAPTCYQVLERRRRVARPIRATPRMAKLVGSGTAAGVANDRSEKSTE